MGVRIGDDWLEYRFPDGSKVFSGPLGWSAQLASGFVMSAEGRPLFFEDRSGAEAALRGVNEGPASTEVEPRSPHRTTFPGGYEDDCGNRYTNDGSLMPEPDYHEAEADE